VKISVVLCVKITNCAPPLPREGTTNNQHDTDKHGYTEDSQISQLAKPQTSQTIRVSVSKSV
ncbi:hypothetical protein QUB11_03865, partial [Microcoleus sp. B6-A1]|uniref:hypothetical protein n=1 Tax=Microcoleus sp. B6-A1 TaxID=2818684 RepID=UPI002FD28A26